LVILSRLYLAGKTPPVRDPRHRHAGARLGGLLADWPIRNCHSRIEWLPFRRRSRGMYPAPPAYFISATASEEIGMSPGAFLYGLQRHKRHDDGGVAWASVIAILFAAVAAVSFVVDQSVTLSSLPVPPPAAGAGR
jgi:hypothetical protein